MGYTTAFHGQFHLNEQLDSDTHYFLTRLAATRRVARRADPIHGLEGEFDISDSDDNIIDINRPPCTQPSLWLHWIPSDDGLTIIWDGKEKFYNYIAWIEYLIKAVLAPKGYRLTGVVEWRGEEWEDSGFIIISRNEVQILNRPQG